MQRPHHIQLTCNALRSIVCTVRASPNVVDSRRDHTVRTSMLHLLKMRGRRQIESLSERRSGIWLQWTSRGFVSWACTNTASSDNKMVSGPMLLTAGFKQSHVRLVAGRQA